MLNGRIRSANSFGGGGLPDGLGSPNIVTLAEVRDFLKIDVGDTSQDAFLSSLILVSSTALETYLDRYVNKRRIVEVFNGNTGPLILTHSPIIQVVTILDGYAAAVPLIDVDMHPIHGAIYPKNPDRSDLFIGRYEVTYDAGWEYAAIPAAIKHGILEWVKGLSFMRLRDPAIASEATDDVGSVDYVWGTSASDQAQAISTGLHGGAVPLTTALLVNSYRRRLS